MTNWTPNGPGKYLLGSPRLIPCCILKCFIFLNFLIYIFHFQCPFCKKDKENLADCVGDKGFCLVKNESGGIQLDRKHSYYFQVQAQLHIMEIDYCDFIVWNENDIYIERVTPDVAFWDCIVPKAGLFFRQCILPEVLGKVFSKPFSTTTLTSSEE